MTATEELAIKAAVRDRDGNRCTECGRTKAEHLERYGRNLHVHRVVPGSAYAVHPGCVTLCIPCHAMKKPNHGYTLVPAKIDDQVAPLAKAAAFLEERLLFDWLSDIANDAASKVLGRKPIKRRPVKRKGD